MCNAKSLQYNCKEELFIYYNERSKNIIEAPVIPSSTIKIMNFIKDNEEHYHDIRSVFLWLLIIISSTLLSIISFLIYVT